MYKQYRDNLTITIKKQLLGKGAVPHLISLLDTEEEILNGKPTGFYYTGILFPKEKTITQVYNPEEELAFENETDIEIEEINTEIDNNNLIDDENEKTEEMKFINTSQMYPNNMGLTICIDKNTNKVPVKYNFRFYSKINNSEIHNHVGLILNDFEENESYTNFLKQDAPLHQYFEIINFESKSVLKRKKEIDDDDLDKIKASFENIKNKLDPKFKEYHIELDKLLYPNRKDEERISKLIAKIKRNEHIFNALNSFKFLLLNKDYSQAEFWISKTISIEKEIDIQAILNTEEKYTKIQIFDKELSDSPFSELKLTSHIQIKKDEKYPDDLFLKILLENNSTEFEKSARDKYYSPFNTKIVQRSIFGTEISIKKQLVKAYRHNNTYKSINGVYPEDEVTKFLYRDVKSYGIGHGTSVSWDNKYVHTDYLPETDLPNITAVPKIKLKNKEIDLGNVEWLQFKWLSDLKPEIQDDEIRKGLMDFSNFYENWINETEQTALGKEPNNKAIINQEMQKCKNDLIRIRQNIDLLKGDTMKAFRLANTAMFIQLWHSVNVGKNEWEVGESIIENENGFNRDFYKNQSDELFKKGQHAAWRPFQLAFILLNLDAFIDNDENFENFIKKRNELVDLVWFPTGGGKTEAYLGIIAFNIIYRRLTKGEKGYGTTVIMRYTLRLLTLQQFQRATRLIMALELIRNWDEHNINLGNEPVSIGLWVGSGFIPNKLRKNNYRNDEIPGLADIVENIEQNQDKIPLKVCPFCGTKLYNKETNDYGGIVNNDNVEFYCLNENCDFNETQIPVLLCDEQIYMNPPTLLFGTVDKFARLAHKISDNKNDDSRRLFGHRRGKKKKNVLPPDLIIQDELHLLNGPLGSSVGLFEYAIDRLATRTINNIEIHPKVISSTATIKNSDEQIKALFNRKVQVFPKPGVFHDDSFFAVYERDENNHYVSKRKYLGILPTGKTQMKTQNQLIAINLAYRVIEDNKNCDENILNYFHTLVSYYGSKREVGKTASQIDTFIRMNYSTVRNRLIFGQPVHRQYLLIKFLELTGRLSDDDVKKNLQIIEKNLYRKNRIDKYRETPDIVLATNMISVGLDISRLNIMIVNSMPKNLSEYIQASSRVAREKEGLVMTLHHPFRVRDVSHFEHFNEVHNKLYSYVEPISITPFTHKVVNRYLTTALITMIRHLIEEYSKNTDANNITKDAETDLIAFVYEYFNTKLSSHSNIDLEYIENHIEKAIKEWNKKKKRVNDKMKKLSFSNNNKAEYTPLYEDAYNFSQGINKIWKVASSLRDVEPNGVIKIKQK